MYMTAENLMAYLTAGRREDMHGKLAVVGHAAPDADAVISSLAEAWRRQVSGIPAVPVIQAQAVPREAAELLGNIAPLLLTTGQPGIQDWLMDSSTRVVLTDHHECPAYRGRVTAVVDHHHPVPGADFTGIDTCMKQIGAATTLVVLRWKEQGLVPDERVAGILLGGILLDTEGLSPFKTFPEDKQAVEWLLSLWKGNPDALYASLQDSLLSETDVTALYHRDYRQFIDPEGHPVVGFAVLKVWEDAHPDEEAVRRLLAQDAADPGYDICLAKISLYTAAGVGDEVYLAAGKQGQAALELVMDMAGPLAQRTAPDRVYLPHNSCRRGRKWLVEKLLNMTEKPC